MSRKLQAEIERVFKKVAEGIEDFEECYDKVLNASNASQKEKYESDLKKEIKKLQRLRDQIKTWLQSNDIKDKQDLLHHRKLIEKQMEKFKAIEKEMKTKAYSKEGLMQSTKLDPKEKEKLDLCNWLVESVDSLSTQIDVLEATAENIEGSLGKKRRDPNKLERLSRLNERAERHKFHIRCLERIQRLLENEGLSTEQVQRIQEDVNYYVEENDDDDFLEDEYIYDELPLDDDDPLFAIPGEDDALNNDSRSESESEEAAPPPKKGPPAEPEPPAAAAATTAAAAATAATPVAAAATTGRSVLGKGASSSKRPGGGSGSSAAQAAVSTATSGSASITVMPQPSTLPPAPVESKNAWTDVKESVLSPSRPSATASTQPPAPPSANLAQPWAAVASQNTNSPATNAPQTPVANGTKATQKQVPGTPTKPAGGKSGDAAAKKGPLSAKGSREQSAEPTASGAAGSEGAEPPLSAASSPLHASTSPVGTKRSSLDEQAQPSMQRPKWFTLFQDEDVPDAFSDLMATFIKAKQQFSAKTPGVYNAQSQMVELSLQGIPTLLDQERPKAARSGPRAPTVATPNYYPQTALPVMEHPGMAPRLDLDTLFFAFYYQPNTYQQYLAAKELNRQSWRFHKKYLTWFQRYEEPVEITDDYEQGTYIYFDYEGAWCQRKKADFRFYYEYLEELS
ncbi:general negative regulator of transcription subunit 5 [Coemansia sp. RSA 552]|nr:general negative regulator of transcription subunit 5 [Coemansia sp. RSA 552]